MTIVYVLFAIIVGFYLGQANLRAYMNACKRNEALRRENERLTNIIKEMTSRLKDIP